jgi:hypothetical protein
MRVIRSIVVSSHWVTLVENEVMLKKYHVWHAASLQIIVSTEEQHANWCLAQIFLVVLRARGRTAGGTASCPGLGDLGCGRMECDSSLQATYLPGAGSDLYPFCWDRILRDLVIHPAWRGG